MVPKEITGVRKLKQEARDKAIGSLARYKFMMFGYHAALWVSLNRIDGSKEPNPFKGLVEKAREMQREEV